MDKSELIKAILEKVLGEKEGTKDRLKKKPSLVEISVTKMEPLSKEDLSKEEEMEVEDLSKDKSEDKSKKEMSKEHPLLARLMKHKK